MGDQRAEVNALGEGAVWVCDGGDPTAKFEAGDCLTTSECPGYAQLQDSPFMCNYTLGKATMDCDFTGLPLVAKQVMRRDGFGNNCVDSTGMPMYDPVLDAEGNRIMEPSYQMRYLKADGTQITAHEYADAVAANDAAIGAGTAAAGTLPGLFRAGFVGCTYHSG